MKIMFFAHDPGGANSIFPLADLLSKNHEIYLFAKGPALKREERAKAYNGELSQIMPDILITGTSANDFTEKNLWKEAKALNIKTIAVLDHWMNYGIRFSKWGIKDKDKFDKTCDYLPDYIIVMDEYAKSEMAKDGVPEDIIYSLGNPHFQEIFENSKKIKDVRPKFAKDNETLITFASEPYIEDYGSGEEKNVLRDIIKALEGEKNIKIAVKLHPKEEFSKYKEFESERVILTKDTTPSEIIKASDVVISMTSMFLIESIILNKKTISYQLNREKDDFFVLTQKGDLPFINNFDDFKRELILKLYSKEDLGYNKLIDINAKERIIKFIEEI